MERCGVCGEPETPGACARCDGHVAMERLLEPAAAKTAVGEFLNGLRLGLRGVRLTLRTPRLLALMIVPFLINVGLLVVFGKACLEFANGLTPEFAEPFIRGFDWLRAPLRATLGWLLDLLALVAALIAMLLVSSVVNAPFHEWISEAVESIVFGRPDSRAMTLSRVLRVWIWPVVQAAFLAILQGILALTFLLASFSGVLAPLATVGSVYLIALTLVDVVIARKACSVRDRFRTVHGGLPTWFGLATPLFFVPVALPIFVAGATLVYLRDLKIRSANRR